MSRLRSLACHKKCSLRGRVIGAGNGGREHTSRRFVRGLGSRQTAEEHLLGAPLSRAWRKTVRLSEAIPSQGPARNTHEDRVSSADTLSKVPCESHGLPRSWPGSKDGKENRSDARPATSRLHWSLWAAPAAPTGGKTDASPRTARSLAPKVPSRDRPGPVSFSPGTRHRTEREGVGQSIRAIQRPEFLG